MPRRIDTSVCIAGLHAVEAQLRNAPNQINHVVVQLGLTNPKLHAVQRLADQAGIRVHQLPKQRLDALFQGPHQGIVAFLDARPMDDWEPIRDELIDRLGTSEPPLIVVPAAMEDPRNLGACIRSSAALGADAMLWHARGAAGLTPTAAKAAAGAEHSIPLCRVTDIEKSLKELRDAGFLLVGLDGHSDQPLDTLELRQGLVVVIGGEDRGIPPHVGRSLTVKASLRMDAKVQSFNASVALALALYEVNRQQQFQRLKSVSP
jgi:23S rRNA (guanosine2251-2'-O)-methyltransferase